MRRYIQHEDLKISHFTTTRWEHPDTHHFEITEETEFTFLKFTNVYLDIPPLLMEAHHRNVPLLDGSPEAGKAHRLIRLITVFPLIQALLSLIRRNMHYLGIFFKEQTGMLLRDYVTKYKLHLIEHQFRYSSHSMKEISNELGFTDQSHFNKFFKTHKGISPSAYRDSHAHPPSNGTKH